MYRQRFKGSVEGFVVNFVAKNIWRVSKLVDREELMQDARTLFYECYDRYILLGNVDNPAWFMSLYKTSFINHFNAISNKVSKLKLVNNFSELSTDEKEFSLEENSYDVDYNLGELMVKIIEAPPQIKEVLSALLDTPLEEMLLIEKNWKEKGKRKLDGNDFICTLIGIDPTENDMVKEVKDYFI
jgi:hypothetical protein